MREMTNEGCMKKFIILTLPWPRLLEVGEAPFAVVVAAVAAAAEGGTVIGAGGVELGVGLLSRKMGEPGT